MLNTPRADDALMADILDLSRQDRIAPLTPWFENRLKTAIANGDYMPVHKIALMAETIISRLIDYRLQSGASTIVLGMSGGVDSAVVAALFKKAGYRVIGITMPIHQNQEETERGVEACKALGLEHLHADLSGSYDAKLAEYEAIVAAAGLVAHNATEIAVNIRKGNLRARTRMEFAYHIAHLVGGFVASTDNWSELVAGFWTLHGDVGDLAPIQSLLKSWEVPAMARYLGVPESTWRATPTDGLGISNGDEAQLGCTYLEWDLMTLAIRDAVAGGAETMEQLAEHIGGQLVIDGVDVLKFKREDLPRPSDVLTAVLGRCGRTWHKRANPINFEHPFLPRLSVINEIDDRLFKVEAAK